MWTCAFEQPFGRAVVEVIDYYADANTSFAALAVWSQTAVTIVLLIVLLRSQSRQKLAWVAGFIASLLLLLPIGTVTYAITAYPRHRI
jgi:hypothetical protein